MKIVTIVRRSFLALAMCAAVGVGGWTLAQHAGHGQGKVKVTELDRRDIGEKLGFTRQKPAFRASQRDEESIARWRSQDRPRIQNKARRRGATIVFVDETGFLLRPLIGKS